MDTTNLIYSVDQKPPFFTLLFLSLQHCLVLASTLAVPLIILTAAGVSMHTEVDLIAASMCAVGIGTILMAVKNRFIGTGFLCPLMCEPAFLLVSLAAVKMGGIHLLFGMTLLAGLFQALFAFIYPYIKKLFSIEVSGIVVLMVGFSLVKPDLLYSLDDNHLRYLQIQWPDLITSSVTLLTMLVLAIWGGKILSRYCLLIGIIIGFVIATWQGLLTFASYAKIWQAPWLAWSVPFTLPTMQFNADLLLPFIVASIATTLIGIGGIINCQKINDAKWIRPEQNSIRKGVLTNGIAIMLSGAMGGIGLGVANNCIGLANATKITSRFVAISTGILFILFAFIPKIAMLFVIMPRPVIGAALIFVTSYIIVSGIQILASRMLDTRKIFVIGLSLMAGVVVQIHPAHTAILPAILRPIVISPIVITTLTAVFLNFIFSIGTATKASLTLSLNAEIEKELSMFLIAQGKSWGAIPQLILDARFMLNACCDELKKMGIQNTIHLQFVYTEYELQVTLQYQGAVLNIEKASSELQNAILIMQKNLPEFVVNATQDSKANTASLALRFIQ